jgi:serine/threonine protein kinase
MATAKMLGDRYQIEEPPIGQGGMGVVYKAFDKVKECFVAIKTLKGEMDSRSIEVFRKEWRLLAQLCHPNIVDVLDVGEFSDNGHQRPYFVMPLLPGLTLDKLIKNSGARLTPERIVDMMCQTCRGLQAAHDRGLVHRDIKPSNLFVMNDDTVKIIDFGIVHLADTESRTGVKGTLQYMAPEQLELKPANAKSDIFSLAVVCYEALTGRKPFERSTMEEVVDAIRSHMPPPASELNPATNEQVSRTVQKAMAKQPYHRFSSAREFSEILQRSMRNEHIELFDRSKIQPRINRIKKALHEGDFQLAIDMLDELVSEGNLDAEITILRDKTEQAARARTIYQFIESARTRMEEGEYPLAMQNVQRVLDLDPANVDARGMKKDIEQRRTAAQVEKWLEIAHQHYENNAFDKARQAVDAIKQFDRSNPAATDLLAAISRGEEETNLVRQEKQQLYDEARKAYRNGEISSALSKLEKVLDLGKRVPGHAATDAQYLAFYEDIRSQRDELQHSYAEGKKALESGDFARAVEICNEGLRLRPGEPLFVALKIEVEEMRRQGHSAAIAQLQIDIEAERDLDRKLAIVNDAVKRFPDEAMFSQSQKFIKERRELVNSLLARAHHYESQHLFLEAKSQWDTIRKVYSLYPGLDYELQRLSRKQEEYGKEEVKAGWVNQIDRALFTGDYGRAEGLLKNAFREAPEDGELIRLQQQIQESAQRGARARMLLEEGQSLVDAGDRPAAIQKLRAARELDSNNAMIRNTLRATLVQHAQALTEHDWRAAVPFIEEGLQIDRTDPDAASVARLVDDLRQREQIDFYILEARGLQTERRFKEGLTKIGQALREYPNEIRLLQLRNILQDAEGAASSNQGSRYAEQPNEPIVNISARWPMPDTGQRDLGATNVFTPASHSGMATPRNLQPVEQSSAQPHLIYRQLRPEPESKRRTNVPVIAWIALSLAAIALLGGGLWWGLRAPRHAPPPKEEQADALKHVDKEKVTPEPPPVGAGKADPSSQAGTSPATVPPPPPAPKPFALYPVHFESSQPNPVRVTSEKNPENYCVTPCDMKFPRGEQTVRVTAPGYKASERTVQVPGERELTLELAVEPQMQAVRVSSDPTDINIAVDNQPQGRTPVLLQLSVGPHTVTLTKGEKTMQTTINVTADEFAFPLAFLPDTQGAATPK